MALVRQLADGGAPCPVLNKVRSGCFCTRGAMQGYTVITFSRFGKNRDTRSGSPAGAGPAGWLLPGGVASKPGR